MVISFFPIVKCAQDVVNDVGGAQEMGMKGILVQTGTMEIFLDGSLIYFPNNSSCMQFHP